MAKKPTRPTVVSRSPSAGRTESREEADIRTRLVNESIDGWRAMQGLPPIDRSKEARSGNE